MVSFLFLAAILSVATRAAVIDSRVQRLPNSLNFTLAALCVSLVILWSGFGSPRQGAVWEFFTLLSLHIGLLFFPERPLGMGDIKFILAVSPLMIWWGVVLTWLLLAYISAAVWSLVRRKVSRHLRIPFGPHLVAATWLVVVGESARVALAYCR